MENVGEDGKWVQVRRVTQESGSIVVFLSFLYSIVTINQILFSVSGEYQTDPIFELAVPVGTESNSAYNRARDVSRSMRFLADQGRSILRIRRIRRCEK